MESLQLTHFVASAVLSRPGTGTQAMLPSLHAATATLPGQFAEPLDRVLSYLDKTDLSTVIAHYAETCTGLRLAHYGDAQRFRQLYWTVGLRVTGLPDHLAVVLEFSAAGYTSEAVELLVTYRYELNSLWANLSELGSPYAHAVAAVLATL